MTKEIGIVVMLGSRTVEAQDWGIQKQGAQGGRARKYAIGVSTGVDVRYPVVPHSPALA